MNEGAGHGGCWSGGSGGYVEKTVENPLQKTQFKTLSEFKTTEAKAF